MEDLEAAINEAIHLNMPSDVINERNIKLEKLKEFKRKLDDPVVGAFLAVVSEL